MDQDMAEITPLSVFQQATETAQYLRISLPTPLRNPRVGIICGSGLGGLGDTIDSEPKYEVAYADIPHFPKSTGMCIGIRICDNIHVIYEEEAKEDRHSLLSVVSLVQGHPGKLVCGLLGEKRTPVVLMVGRAHFYEGHTIEKITFPVRVLKVLGIESIIVTNAAGGLSDGYSIGDVVVVQDHLNLAGLVGIHPLRGPNEDNFGVRFPALSDAYDLELRRIVHRAWKSLRLGQNGRRIHEGVYAFVGGPSYETRAECRLLHSLGADLVGMSTVPEIIVARHSGLRVLALSLVTNIAVLDAGPKGDNVGIQSITGRDLNKAIEKGKANHGDVLAAGLEAAKDIQVLVKRCVDDMFTV